MSVRSALLPSGLHVASIIGAGTLTDGRFQPFAFLPIPREIPGSFIGLTNPNSMEAFKMQSLEKAIFSMAGKTNGNQAHPVKVPSWTMAWMVGGIGLMKS